MAHFYGDMEGSAKTQATRCGTKKSGISAHVRGWHFGVKVWVWYNAETGEDMVDINLTGGSKNTGRGRNLGTFKKSDIEG